MSEPRTIRVRLEDGTEMALRLTGIQEDLETTIGPQPSFRDPVQWRLLSSGPQWAPQ